MKRHTSRAVLIAAGLAASSTWLVAGGIARTGAPLPMPADVRVIPPWPVPDAHAKTVRAAALAQAEVWRPTHPSSYDFAGNPPDPSGELSQPVVTCRFLPKAATGTTPKFDCVLASGDVVKVKYGSNPENHAEAAATRLLTALGFGADTVYLVPRLRCYGCPRFPFHTMRVVDLFRAAPILERHMPQRMYTDFEWVSVERRFEAWPIEVEDDAGWGWFELPASEEVSGERRTHLDAFRLMAVFLAHWDNKTANQRLVCLAEPPTRRSDKAPLPCPEPFALIQDGGATFGPRKVDLDSWRATPVWRDAASCTVSMRDLPWGGGTFVDAQISEAGRLLLLQQLTQLTESQVRSLFAGARFAEFEAERWFGPAAGADDWSGAFRDKVRAIAAAGPCPS